MNDKVKPLKKYWKARNQSSGYADIFVKIPGWDDWRLCGYVVREATPYRADFKNDVILFKKRWFACVGGAFPRGNRFGMKVTGYESREMAATAIVMRELEIEKWKQELEKGKK